MREAAPKSDVSARMTVGLKPWIQDVYADGDTAIVHFDAQGTACD